ncbi:MAG: AI-2E family transporter [Oscillospiraceae bacterium]
MNKIDKMVIKYTIWGFIIILGLMYFDNILKFLGSVWNVIFPLLLGLCMAYVLNIVMKSVEKKFPHMKRAISIILSLLLIIGVLTLTCFIVIPQFTDACSIIQVTIPRYFNLIKVWVLDNQDKLPTIAQQIAELQINWDSIFQKIVAFATNSTGTLLSTTVSFIGSVTSGVFNVLMGLIFAVYILANKEKLSNKIMITFKVSKHENIVDRIILLLKTADKCFSSFVIGQCKEAFILGFLCMLGTFVICPKYAVMVGVLIGITAFIPILGAYIGGAIGAFVVFTEEPIRALYFIIFLVILQQVEGNLIYPKVVGETVGIPGILVFTAVTIGGGLAGIPGMFLSVPIMAVIYQFYNEYLNKHYQRVEPVAVSNDNSLLPVNENTSTENDNSSNT